MASCKACAADLQFLKMADRPDYEKGSQSVRMVDLFAGGGGLTMGAAEAARRAGLGLNVTLAVEKDSDVADVFALNFPHANLQRSDVAKLFDGALGARPTRSERELVTSVGQPDLLVAGPPCQGHSDLNNHTRRDDPRNALYLRTARAAEVLRPTFVLIENVPSVRHDKGDVVSLATTALESAGYSVVNRVLDLVRFGVPQRRRRHILLAVLGDRVDPDVVLDIRSPCENHSERTVRWAIADLLDPLSDVGTDAPSTPTPTNLARMQWLITKDQYDLPNSMRPPCHQDQHTYNAMYGRLAWDEPAPTITTGFGSMGQGRFVHPAKARTLTPHEAARLQTLPDFFDLDATKGRGVWATVIGNAVPPLLGAHLIEPLLCAVRDRAATSPRRALMGGRLPEAEARGGSRRRNGVPLASSELIRTRMANTKSHDTKPELEVRSNLHRMGLRFFVDRKIAHRRRRCDIVFPTERVAVFVDGCFWHACPLHGTVPKQNRSWWTEKLAANRRRDEETDEVLRAEGWAVLRFWEHEDPAVAASRVFDVVMQRRAGDAHANRLRK